jgi:hypothetical protein
MNNAFHGGWSPALAERFMRLSRDVFSLPRLDALTEFRT